MAFQSNGVTPPSQSAAQNAVGRMGLRAPGHMRYTPPPPESFLNEGQIIKGEITDLRNNEVTVLLEDNTKITGELENSPNLSIGDTAAFKVTSKNEGAVTLKALPKRDSVLENATIQKALDAAGLPKNEKNQEIVRELMKNQMPIHKQAILQILKEAYENKEVSVAALVIMTKHKIPITPETALQMDHYRNYEHRLVKELSTIADLIPPLLKELSGENSPLSPIPFADRLFGLLMSSREDEFLSPGRNPVARYDSLQGPARLVDILETFSLSGRLKEEILNETASLRDVTAAIAEGLEIAQRLDEAPNILLEGGRLPVDPPPEEAAFTPEELIGLPKAVDLFDEPVIHSLLKDLELLQREYNELASFLTPEQRTALSGMLKQLPISRLAAAEAEEGTTTAKELLSAVKNALTKAEAQPVRELLSSDEFLTVVREAVLGGFTMTPGQLPRKGAVKEFYQQLYEQVTQLRALCMAAGYGYEELETLSFKAGQVKDNIDFMQLLNGMYTYVQLPVRFPDRCLHSDLYVYTRKDRLREHPEAVSVLFHLDMEYMGPLDIHISLESSRAAAKFYCAEEASRDLISSHLESLNQALAQKGFHLTAEARLREKDIDIVKDFIEKDLPSTSLKRYNFDIRA